MKKKIQKPELTKATAKVNVEAEVMRIAASLNLDPLDGDEGERTKLTDKAVRANKEHECNWCFDIIKKGDYYRALTDIFDGEIATYRYCINCCDGMVDELKNPSSLKFEKRARQYA